MPIQINMLTREKPMHPLEKLANAVAIAKAVYGISADTQTLDLARKKLADEENDPVKKYARQTATSAMANDTALKNPNSPETQQRRSLLMDMISGVRGSEAFKTNKTVFDQLQKQAPNMSGSQIDEVGKNPLLQAVINQGKTNAGLVIRSEAAAAKANDQADNHFDKVTTALEGMRGNPAVAQAEKDVYASQKVDSLANLYSDPNKLSGPQVNLLVSEVGKIAQGGSPSMHELDGLSPGTLQGALSTAWGKLQNEPNGANAAEFVKQLQQYSRSVAEDAKGVINDRYGRIINTHKNRLSADQFQALQNNYLNRFAPSEKTAPKGQGPSGAVSFEEFMKAKGK